MSYPKKVQEKYITTATHIPAWYEFVLNPNFLEEHLKQTNPEPNAPGLIKLFLDKMNQIATESQPADFKTAAFMNGQRARSTKSLKSLAFQTAAILRWRIKVIENELPIASCNKLVTTFVTHCGINLPLHRVNCADTLFSGAHDHTIAALVTYCRWAAVAMIKANYKTKNPGKNDVYPTGIHVNMATAQQRANEIREQINHKMKDQIVELVASLEKSLTFSKPLYMPTAKTMQNNMLLSNDPKRMEYDWIIPYEEYHAQVRYDLGCFHFAHGFHKEALELFRQVREAKNKFPRQTSGYCEFEEDKLLGYSKACEEILNYPGQVVPSPFGVLCQTIQDCLKQNQPDIKVIFNSLEEDLHKCELTAPFIESVEKKLLKCFEGTDKIFDIKWMCALLRCMRKLPHPVYLWSEYMYSTNLKRLLDLIERTYEKLTYAKKECMKVFLHSMLANLSGEPNIHEVMFSHQAFKNVFNAATLLQLECKFKSKNSKYIAAATAVTEEPADQGSPSDQLKSNQSSKSSMERPTKVVELRRKLLTTVAPEEIKKAIKELANVYSEEHSFITECRFWLLPSCYNNLLNSMPIKYFGRDLLTVFLAKIVHCVKDGEFKHAKSLLEHLKTEPSLEKYRQLLTPTIMHELLRVDLIETLTNNSLHYKTRDQCAELRVQLSETITGCKQLQVYINERVRRQNIPTDLVPLSVALQLNLEDYDNLKLPGVRNSQNGFARFSGLLASVQSAIDQNSSSSSSEFFSALIHIFYLQKPKSLQSLLSVGKMSVKMVNSVKDEQGEWVHPKAQINRSSLLKLICLIKNPRLLRVGLYSHVYAHACSLEYCKYILALYLSCYCSPTITDFMILTNSH